MWWTVLALKDWYKQTETQFDLRLDTFVKTKLYKTQDEGKFAIFIVQIPKKSLPSTLLGLDICFSCLKYKCCNSKSVHDCMNWSCLERRIKMACPPQQAKKAGGKSLLQLMVENKIRFSKLLQPGPYVRWTPSPLEPQAKQSSYINPWTAGSS